MYLSSFGIIGLQYVRYMIVEKWKSYIWLWMYRVKKKKYRVDICQQITEFYSIWLTISLLIIFLNWRLWDITVMCFTTKSCINRKGFCRVITEVFEFCYNWQLKNIFYCNHAWCWSKVHFETHSKILHLIKLSPGNEDIVNGNVKLILGLLWHLIVRYQISSRKTKVPPKKLMLNWFRLILPELEISNFTSDWSTGIPLQ